jgi:hypothetical protein
MSRHAGRDRKEGARDEVVKPRRAGAPREGGDAGFSASEDSEAHVARCSKGRGAPKRRRGRVGKPDPAAEKGSALEG